MPIPHSVEPHTAIRSSAPERIYLHIWISIRVVEYISTYININIIINNNRIIIHITPFGHRSVPHSAPSLDTPFKGQDPILAPLRYTP